MDYKVLIMNIFYFRSDCKILGHKTLYKNSYVYFCIRNNRV